MHCACILIQHFLGAIMNPLYQGKIDNFCAAYSVLNAFRLVSGISAFQARDILNHVFIEEAKDIENWERIVKHECNYLNMVRSILEKWKVELNYQYFCPFAYTGKEEPIMGNDFLHPQVDLDTVWETLMQFVKYKKGTAVIRFCRFLPKQIGPIVDHWSTVAKIDEHEMVLYDCSLEATGWYLLEKERFFSAPFGAIPPQGLALKMGYNLDLAENEFGVICPDYIHIIESKASPFDMLKRAFNGIDI